MTETYVGRFAIPGIRARYMNIVGNGFVRSADYIQTPPVVRQDDNETGIV